MFGKRFTRALVVVAATSLTMTAVAFADNISTDGDTLKAGNNLNYTTTVNASSNLCATRGTAVTGEATISRTGGSPNLTAGELVTLTTTSPNAGIVVSSGHTANVPSTWSGGASFSINYTTTVSSSLADGAYVVGVSVTGATSGAVLTDSFTVNIACAIAPTNSPPEITSAAFAATSVGCRVSSELQVAFTDADAGDTHTATVDWGDGSAVENLGAVTSPFSAYHTYTAPGSYTATVTVSDGTDSDTATAGITVNQTYTVSFLQPLNGSVTGDLVANTFKNGRVLPVKATIYDDCALTAVDGSSSITPTIKLERSALTGGTDTDAVSEYADAGQSSGNTDQMRWSDDGFWIYNLDSKALGMKSGSHYRLNIFLGDTQATTTQWVILSPQRESSFLLHLA